MVKKPTHLPPGFANSDILANLFALLLGISSLIDIISSTDMDGPTRPPLSTDKRYWYQRWGHFKIAFALNLRLHLQISMELKMRKNLSRKCNANEVEAILKK